MDRTTGAGLAAGVVRGAAARLKQRLAADIADPDPGDDRDGVMPGEWMPGPYGLPPDCPVQPLGMDGQTMFMIDALGQLAVIPGSRQLGQDLVQRMFGSRQNYLYWAWPRRSKEGAVTGWRTELVREHLYAACARKGLWRAINKVRGLGAWSAPDGGLVVHCGDVLWRNGKLVHPGEHDGYFYPRRPKVAHPWPDPVGPEMNPAGTIVEALGTWSWKRPRIDPILFVGWIGAGMLGGALPWRPSMFLVGDKGTGKSSLQELVAGIFGEGLVSTPDTTPAGIYQRIGNDALPIAVDELESDPGGGRAMGVVKLARLAASGGLMLRGGSDHAGVEFQARSTFLFSAINPPPLAPQDLSRIAILTMDPLDPTMVSRAPRLQAAETIGPRILRRLIDQWPNFQRTFDAYRAALRAGGHGSRGQDTYGTFLTCAHLLLGDEWLEAHGYPMERLDGWADLLGIEALPDETIGKDNWRACVDHLLGCQIDTWRGGERATVGQLIEDLEEGLIEMKAAQRALAQCGLGVTDDYKLVQAGLLPRRPERKWASLVLFVPNDSPQVSKIYAGTTWGGPGGTGVWGSALRQCPTGAVVTDKRFNKLRIGGVEHRCTMVSIAALTDGG